MPAGMHAGKNPETPVATQVEPGITRCGELTPTLRIIAARKAVGPAASLGHLQVILYKSETTALTDLVAGRVQAMLITGALAQHVCEGRVRGLATLLSNRSKALPDLPTMAEAGMQPFPALAFMGLFGPAKMPKEIVDRLKRELMAALRKPEVRDAIERTTMEITPLSASAMGALATEQTEVWRRLTREAGIVPE